MDNTYIYIYIYIYSHVNNIVIMVTRFEYIEIILLIEALVDCIVLLCLMVCRYKSTWVLLISTKQAVIPNKCQWENKPTIFYVGKFAVPQIEHSLGGSSKKCSHVYFLLIVAMALLLWCHFVLLWHQVTMVVPEQHLYQTIV